MNEIEIDKKLTPPNENTESDHPFATILNEKKIIDDKLSKAIGKLSGEYTARAKYIAFKHSLIGQAAYEINKRPNDNDYKKSVYTMLRWYYLCKALDQLDPNYITEKPDSVCKPVEQIQF